MLKAGVRAILHGAGAIRLIRARNRSGLRILMHHRFPAEQKASLAAQCAHIRKYYAPVSMSDVARCLRSGDPLPPNAVAITIDDGYRDFYDRASPMFAGHEIPVTMYLVTDFLDGKDWLWMDRIKYAIAHTRMTSVEMSLSGQTMRFPLGNQGERDHASRTLREKTKRATNGERLQFIDSLQRLT